MKNKIDELMNKQKFLSKKNPEESGETRDLLLSLGVKDKSEFMKFYSLYFGRDLIHNGCSDIVDPALPQKSLLRATNMAHNVWDIPKNYILFTTGEGEGGYLYRVDDDTVWDFTLGEQDILGTDKMRHWNSFYEFLEWYLMPDETE